MIKKILSLLLVFITSLTILTNVHEVYATEVSDTGINGVWHVTDGNRVYIHKRLTIEDYSNYDSMTSSGYVISPENKITETIVSDVDHYLNFDTKHIKYLNGTSVNSQIANPDPNIYTRFYVQMKTPDGEHRTIKELENVGYAMLLLTDFFSPNGLIFNPTASIGMFGQAVTGSEAIDYVTLGDFNLVYSGSGLTQYSIRMFWETADVVDPGEPTPENPIPWLSNLPNMTDGNPENINGEWGNVTGFNYNHVTKLFNASVVYDGKSYPIVDAVVDTLDDGFLQRTQKAYYFTQNGQKFLYLNFNSANTSFMLKNYYQELKDWRGHALWNLTTGEVNVMDTIKAFQYLKFTNDHELMSYFYIIDTPVDDLISVTSNVAYRYWNATWFGLGPKEPGPIQNKIITAAQGEFNSIRPTWVKPVYQTSYFVGIAGAAIGVNAILLGTSPWFGLGVAGVGFLTGGLLQYADQNEWLNYDIEQVQKLDPNPTIRSEMSAAYYEAYQEALPSTLGKSLYRISYGQFEQADLQVIKEQSSVVQIIFETDGIVHTYNEEQIDDEWTGPATEEPDNIDGILPEWVLWLSLIAVIAIVVGNLERLIKLVVKRPIITFALGIGILYALMYFGVF